jgi:hypothetical protein
MAHKGRATSDVTFNPDDPPEAYNNPTIQPRIAKYTTVARQVRGPDFDPVREPLDSEIVVMIGEGRKHGRYFVGDSLLVSRDVPTLSQIRSRVRARAQPRP